MFGPDMSRHISKELPESSAHDPEADLIKAQVQGSGSSSRRLVGQLATSLTELARAGGHFI